MPSFQRAVKPLAENLTRSFLAKRTFSATAVMGNKTEWMCIIPDKPNVLDTRMKIRPQHLEELKPKIQAGLVVFGGASLDEPIQEGAGPKVNGSVMLCLAETREGAVKLINEDIYTRSGVWDAERAQIFSFRTAVREPLS